MSYQLIQLAPGAYDVMRDDEIIASVVRHGPHSPSKWSAELLNDLPPPERPAPFTEIEHQFSSLEAVRDWLGHPPVKAIRCAREP
ncbi:hypothetical protein [Microvirga massiliensis]|uniref:hypothetical protein n=1 Tax=Microvirga massiliensis TaxID=1033741 RepID=UPI00062B4628|nr:hypothetical protein [Microvirga massiliensis]